MLELTAGGWILAVLASIAVGLAKGGLAMVAMLAVPLLSLVMSPVQAAGLMLPVYVASDVGGLIAFRRAFDLRVLATALPLVGAAGASSAGRFVGEYDWTVAESPDGLRIDHGLLDRAHELARMIAAQSPTAVRRTLALLRRRTRAQVDDLLPDAWAAIGEMWTHPDVAEATAARAEGRAPRWADPVPIGTSTHNADDAGGEEDA